MYRLLFVLLLCHAAHANELQFILRHQWLAESGTPRWATSNEIWNIPTNATALLLMDTWDQSTCGDGLLFGDMNAAGIAYAMRVARHLNIPIIHSLNGIPAFTDNHPAHARTTLLPEAPGGCPCDISIPEDLPPPAINDGQTHPFPVEYPCAWITQTWPTRVHPMITIDPDRDFIALDGQELYKIIYSLGLKYILYVGGATNMCIIGRPQGIRFVRAMGITPIVLRELSLVSDSPLWTPYLHPQEAADIQFGYIEKFLAYTASATDLVYWNESKRLVRQPTPTGHKEIILYEATPALETAWMIASVAMQATVLVIIAGMAIVQCVLQRGRASASYQIV